MEKVIQLHTHKETDSVTHTVAARDADLKGHFLAAKCCFSAIIS